MLIGEYLTPVGDKNRIALPKKLRLEMTDDLIITRGYERCLLLVDKNRWHSLITEINKHPLLSMSVRDTKRFLLGGAFDLEIDKQGRFVIPEALVSYSRIDEQTQPQVVFLGLGEWVEIWSQDQWEQKLENLSENSADIAERLGQTQ